MEEYEYHFRGQRAGERVEMFLRQHPFVLVEHAVKAIGLVLLAVFLMRILGAGSVILIMAGVLIVLAVVIVIRSWYGWWNTMLLLTGERVLFVEQEGFTSRKVSEALLDNIQFVTHEIVGLVHTMFNFGMVRIQTGGAAEVLIIKEIVDPYDVQQHITRLQTPGKHPRHEPVTPPESNSPHQLSA